MRIRLGAIDPNTDRENGRSKRNGQLFSEGIPPNSTEHWTKRNQDFWKFMRIQAEFYPLRFLSLPITSELGAQVLKETADTVVNGDFTTYTETTIVLRLPNCLICTGIESEFTMFSQPFKVFQDDDPANMKVISSGPSCMYFLHRYPYNTTTFPEPHPKDLILPLHCNIRLVTDTLELKGKKYPFADYRNYRCRDEKSGKWRPILKKEWGDNIRVALMYPGDSEKLFGSGGLCWTCTDMYQDIPPEHKIAVPPGSEPESDGE